MMRGRVRKATFLAAWGMLTSGVATAGVTADGQLLGNLLVSTFDLNGSGGVNAADVSAWLVDKNSGVYRERSDFDGNGVVNAADVSLWLAERHQADPILVSALACR